MLRGGFLPQSLASRLERAIPYQFALGYLALAAMLLLLSLSKESKEPPPADDHHAGAENEPMPETLPVTSPS
jgi:hypothetical protein